ncbi:MAG TPA: SDR family NAD(P)-dependent oxidoreductase [Pirellulales bacterium]|jgi:NAD(P)-dependent dehydrogenase (short-subunit alcohol dehydrogenase family)
MPEQQKTIVLTGVSRGLGLAMAEGFIAAGHRLCGCARSGAAVEELRRRWPAPHRFDVVDVADDAQVARWASEVLEQLGAPDLLINNAALMNECAVLWKVPPEEFRRLMDVNVLGTYYVIRHFVPAMVARGSGVIVNFSSGWGRSTSPEVAPYCATKWAIEGLTQSLSQELPTGMAAVAFNPGVINTDMLRTSIGATASSYQSPTAWAKKTVPLILGLSAKHNGEQVGA